MTSPERKYRTIHIRHEEWHHRGSTRRLFHRPAGAGERGAGQGFTHLFNGRMEVRKEGSAAPILITPEGEPKRTKCRKETDSLGDVDVHYATDNDLTLKAAALKLGFVTEAEFDRVVDPKKMVRRSWLPVDSRQYLKKG